MKVFALPEGRFTVDQSKVFKPYQKGINIKGSIVVDIVPFLVKHKGFNILIDCGLGLYNKEQSLLQIEENLQAYNTSCAAINLVLISHLHKDHISGLFRSEQSYMIPNFPNAKHIISKNEFSYALHHPQHYPKEILIEIEKKLDVDFVGEQGDYNDFIRFEEKGGHSPFHLIFYLHTAEQTYLYGGDIFPQPEQGINRIKAKYDVDPELCMNVRLAFVEQMAQDGTTGLFYHSSHSPITTFSYDSNGKITLKRMV